MLQVGKGEDAYARAKQFVSDWRHMDLGWVDTNRPDVKVGAEVCVMARLLGLMWMSNPLRIAYVSEKEAALPGKAHFQATRHPPCSAMGAR